MTLHAFIHFVTLTYFCRMTALFCFKNGGYSHTFNIAILLINAFTLTFLLIVLCCVNWWCHPSYCSLPQRRELWGNVMYLFLPPVKTSFSCIVAYPKGGDCGIMLCTSFTPWSPSQNQSHVLQLTPKGGGIGHATLLVRVMDLLYLLSKPISHVHSYHKVVVTLCTCFSSSQNQFLLCYSLPQKNGIMG